ncbi:MAG: ORF6N domain-containing protein, partial [Bacteroidetes bacterium]|nr:ORF6N domain-containing protein [Bacteroidota bacterium]
MKAKSVIPTENAINKILIIRNQKVILDRDLALLYKVETRALKQAVKRNIKRFPPDFMFVLFKKEIDLLVSQNVIPSKRSLGGSLPYVFTEQGVAMLSSVLRSPRAIEVNIGIMRAFVQMRQLLASQKGLMRKILDMETKYDAQFKIVFTAIRQLMEPPKAKPKHRIGFKSGKDDYSPTPTYSVKKSRSFYDH